MKKLYTVLAFMLLAAMFLSACGVPPIKVEAFTPLPPSTAAPATATSTPLPGFTKTLAVGESVTATNGVDRAIEIKYEGTITDTYICNDGTMTTCSVSVGNNEFDFVVDGIKIGHAVGATVTIFSGWGETKQ